MITRPDHSVDRQLWKHGWRWERNGNHFYKLLPDCIWNIISRRDRWSLGNITSAITDDMNQALIAHVTKWEVKLAPFAMHPEKPPWPDSMSVLFYQKFWNIVKGDLTHIVNEFLFQDINHCTSIEWHKHLSHIKKWKIYVHGHFRLISFCNVRYKIISKVICKRLKKILSQRISKT